jgi:HAD superfamily hydrolase (TIGR01509 family)
MKNRLIIFDLDGTLIDSKHVHFNALNKSLAEIDNRLVISEKDQQYIYEGLPTTEKLKILTHRYNLSPSLYEKIWSIKQKYTTEEFSKLNPDDELINIFKYIKSNEIKVAVASNSIKNTVNLILEKLGILPYIDYVVSNEDVVNPKPHPEMFWKCMSYFNCLPEETIILEDSVIGKMAAYNSGSKLIEVQNRSSITLGMIEKNVKELIDRQSSSFGKKINIVIPMAGAGSRFSDAGYTFPKPLIDVNGKPMVQLVIDNLSIEGNYIFIVQKEHYEKYNLEDLLNLISPNCTIIQVDGILDGAAKTVLLAKKYIDNDYPLIISNCDQVIDWDSKKFIYDIMTKNSDGSILLFNATHPKWSYAKINDYGMISEVAEKRVISNNATVGVYYWKHGSDFVKYADQMIAKNIKTNNEFYVCPVYNEALLDNKKIHPFFVDKMFGIGTPEDLDSYLKGKNV